MTAVVAAILRAYVSVGIVALRILARLLRMVADLASDVADLIDRARTPATT